MTGIPYPVKVQKVPLIKSMNNLRINIFGYEKTELYILYASDKTNEDTINLLLCDGENTHYTLIRDFSRFMSHRNKDESAYDYCYTYLHGFIKT